MANLDDAISRLKPRVARRYRDELAKLRELIDAEEPVKRLDVVYVLVAGSAVPAIATVQANGVGIILKASGALSWGAYPYSDISLLTDGKLMSIQKRTVGTDGKRLVPGSNSTFVVCPIAQVPSGDRTQPTKGAQP